MCSFISLLLGGSNPPSTYQRGERVKSHPLSNPPSATTPIIFLCHYFKTYSPRICFKTKVENQTVGCDFLQTSHSPLHPKQCRVRCTSTLCLVNACVQSHMCNTAVPHVSTVQTDRLKYSFGIGGIATCEAPHRSG